MTLFFFLVGLEVKRELTIGELTDRSRAIVPMAAALAGLIVPALIFVLFNLTSGEADAWGVVISTDTAFLLGALALIGPKYPSRLRIFLLTLAVVDDIGALLAIGVFYNAGIDPVPFIVAIAIMALLAFVRFLPAGRGIAYFGLGARAVDRGAAVGHPSDPRRRRGGGGRPAHPGVPAAARRCRAHRRADPGIPASRRTPRTPPR